MCLSLIEALYLDVQSTWINKAQYVDAELKFHIAMQKQNEYTTPPNPLVEALRLDAQSMWINKARYAEAERKFHIAMQNENNEETPNPEAARLRKRVRKNRRSKIQDNQMDPAELAGVTSQVALNILANQSQYVDIQRLMEQNQILKSSNSKTPIPKPKSENLKASSMKQRNGLTPYQGNKRCFGEFHCKRCHRKWQSGFSWADMGQQCKQCKWMIYPYKQHQLEARDGNDENGSMPGVIKHDTQKCEKCQRINGDCRVIGRRNQRNW